MQTHYLERDFVNSNVRAIFSARPQRKALVFVHGYGGGAISTWSEFPTLLPQRSEVAGHDLYFYGYDGVRSELIASAALFRGFLERLADHSASSINSSLPEAPRPIDFQYEELTVVAHSLGAVIARWALLPATRYACTWQPRTKLILFAPAHTGCEVGNLALAGIAGFKFLLPIAALAQFRSPLVRQLKPDSPELQELRKATVEAIQKGLTHLIPRKVIIAQFENIVSNLKLCSQDPDPISIENTNHTTVCKPNPAFSTPIDLVLESL